LQNQRGFQEQASKEIIFIKRVNISQLNKIEHGRKTVHDSACGAQTRTSMLAGTEVSIASSISPWFSAILPAGTQIDV
jgi:hypothetical protein